VFKAAIKPKGIGLNSKPRSGLKPTVVMGMAVLASQQWLTVNHVKWFVLFLHGLSPLRFAETIVNLKRLKVG